jgi:soluble cytochrome b562
MTNPKGNTLAAEALEALRTLHKDHQNTDARQQVEKAGKIFREKQSKMVEKLDGIYELLQQWNISSGRGSAQKSQEFNPLNLHLNISNNPS